MREPHVRGKHAWDSSFIIKNVHHLRSIIDLLLKKYSQILPILQPHINAKGGNLAVRFETNEDEISNIWLCGKAEMVFEGKINAL
ncbi:MAG TPA: hypothetical protein ENJ53_07345 [Phaeodactylibacter sp.]|nr:hypothetical protein [Phaeodactylibacter sp.]